MWARIVRKNAHGVDKLIDFAIERHQRQRAGLLGPAWLRPVGADVEISHPLTVKIVIPLNDMVRQRYGGLGSLKGHELILNVELMPRFTVPVLPHLEE